MDVGANVGVMSQYFLDRGAKVLAFEPNQHARKVLEARIGTHPSLTVSDAAVATSQGSSRLYLHENHREDEVVWSSGSSLLSTKSNVSEDYDLVPTVDIAEVLNGLPPIKLIKIDVEGTEYELIDQIMTAERLPEYLICESHHYKNPDLKEKFERTHNMLIEQKLSPKWTMDWI